MDQSAWDALKAIAADPRISAQRPKVGTSVRVIEGKRLGVTGTVTWHGLDKYSTAYRYCSDMQAHLRDLRGQWGFRVRITPDDGSEAFFIGAEKVCVL